MPLGAGGAAVRQPSSCTARARAVIPSDGGGKIGTVFKVQMASYDDATKAIAALDGLKWRGSKLKVGRAARGQELDNFMVAERMLHKTAFEVSTIGVSTNDPRSAATSRCSGRRRRTRRAITRRERAEGYDMRQWDDMLPARLGKGRTPSARRSAVPLGVAFGLMSRTVELNTSQHIPTIIPHTHRRQTFHLMTDAEKDPRDGPNTDESALLDTTALYPLCPIERRVACSGRAFSCVYAARCRRGRRAAAPARRPFR